MSPPVRSFVGSMALLVALLSAAAGCKKDQPAAAGKDGATAKVASADAATTPPVEPVADRCDLIGRLELRTVTPAKDCGQPGRYATLSFGLTAIAPRGDTLELEIAEAGDLGNVLAVAETPRTPTGGTCAVTLTISDAGRADDDEQFTFKLAIPAAGGAIKGELTHIGSAPDGKECTTNSAVEGTLTRGAAAAPTPTAPGALDGPHASLEAYCARRTAGFVAADCVHGDEGDLCSCQAATTDLVDGTLTAKASGGDLTEAALLVTAARKADYARCEIALKVPAGWYVLPDAFPCGPAPLSHDGGVAVKVSKFEASHAGSEDTVRLAWKQTLTGGDGSDESLFELSCKVASGAAPSCTPAQPRP